MIRYIFAGLLLTFLAAVLSALIFWAVFDLCFHCNFDSIKDIKKREHCTTPIKFNHWRDMYYLNPEKWNIGSALPSIWASYRDDDGHYNRTTNIYVNFKGIDAVRYSLFAYNAIKNKEEEIKKKNVRTATITVLQTMEKEIEKIKKQSQEEFEQSAKQTKEIKNKLFKEYCN